jgi:prophage DNA circulation protein
MQIMEHKNPWRNKLKGRQAQFREAIFFVETDARGGGRRVAVHQYPKRNTPYSEDMGRAANRFIVQGYLIGPNFGNPNLAGPAEQNPQNNYLDLKDALIAALEKDGPGRLRLPLPYQMADQYVMVMSYTVTEARERGGMCMLQMEFVEYGDPVYRQTVSTAEEINKSATAVENAAMAPLADPPPLPTAADVAPTATDEQIAAAAPYAQVYQSANIDEIAAAGATARDLYR